MKPKAFTLIELLVVIAIIAILAAILFPVFAQAKEAAKKTQSLSNVKQQILGVTMYATDHDDVNTLSEYGTGVPAEITPGLGQLQQWYLLVDPYIKSGLKEVSNGQPAAYGRGGIWDDPGFPDKAQGQHYGLNSDIFPSNYGINALTNPGNIKRALSITELEAPADKVAILNKNRNGCTWNYPYFDAAQWFWTPTVAPDANRQPTRDGSEIASGQIPRDHGGFLNRDSTTTACNWPEWELGAAPRFRYAGTAIAGFMDGHARPVKRGQLQWFKNIAVNSGQGWWRESWYPY